MSIADSTRMGLAKKRMSHQCLADKIGVRRETVSSWCNGHSTPGNDRQLKIAKAFGVSLSTFIGWGE